MHLPIRDTYNTRPDSSSPEDEDEEHEEHAEGGHIVHGLHEDHELPAQSRHEAHQLYHPQQPEGPQHGETAVRLTDDLTHTETHAHSRDMNYISHLTFFPDMDTIQKQKKQVLFRMTL